MSFRKLGLLAVLVAGFLVFTPSAHAQACTDPGGCYQNLDDGFNGWENLDPYGTGPTKPPTMLSCHARASLGQGCRDCRGKYDDSGVFQGYYVCGYVTVNAGCTCDNAGTPNCKPQGDCYYS